MYRSWHLVRIDESSVDGTNMRMNVFALIIVVNGRHRFIAIFDQFKSTFVVDVGRVLKYRGGL